MLPDHVETLIVGGGQAGLTMSHMLSRRHCPHLVLERSRMFERWRSERWDGLRFQFPNWSVKLPDFPFRHANPDGFATSAEIVDYLDAYASRVKPQIQCGVVVAKLRRDRTDNRFVVETSAGSVTADSVVVATGPYQRPVIPDSLAKEIDLFQVHASATKARSASARTGVGRRIRSLRCPNSRGTRPRRAPGLPVGRQTQAHAAAISWT